MFFENLFHFFTGPWFVTFTIVLHIFIFARLFRKIRDMRVNRAIEKMAIEKVENPNEKDEEAYEILNQVRTDIWLEWNALKKKSEKDKETEVFSVGLFYGYVMKVSEAIAAVYYPEMKNPHYLAKIEDLAILNNRIFSRIDDILSLPFLKKLKRFNIDSILKIHRLYTSPLGFIFRNRETRKAMKQISGAINIINPWYWARQYLTEYSLETATRFFIVKFITIIGEEAVILYGDKEEEKSRNDNEKLLMMAMIRALLTEKEAISKQDFEDIYIRLFENDYLDENEKIEILKYLAGKKKFNDKDCPLEKLQKDELPQTYREQLDEYRRDRSLQAPKTQLLEGGE
jgi:GTPase SAR1 family protein